MIKRSPPQSEMRMEKDKAGKGVGDSILLHTIESGAPRPGPGAAPGDNRLLET